MFRGTIKSVYNGLQTGKFKRLFSEYIKENIIIKTSGKYQPEALVWAIIVTGTDLFLFATDYPFGR